MKIAAHLPVAVNLRRTSPGHVAQRMAGSLSAATATKSGLKNPVTPALNNPFSSLFQSFSQPAASSLPTRPPGPVSVQTPLPVVLPAPADTAAAADADAAAAVVKPGMTALVNAIKNGTFQATYVTDPTKLKETTPFGTDAMPNFYYASDQTAAQLAQLLGGKVVQMPAFGQTQGWNEPNANFIQLPNGQTVKAADLAYFAKFGRESVGQLTADLTQTINQGAAWSNYYKNGGQFPDFPMYFVGPPISGMDYPPGTVTSDGAVFNPAAQGIKLNT